MKGTHFRRENEGDRDCGEYYLILNKGINCIYEGSHFRRENEGDIDCGEYCLILRAFLTGNSYVFLTSFKSEFQLFIILE